MNKADRLFRALGAPCAGCGQSIPESVLRNWETRPRAVPMYLAHEQGEGNYQYWNIRYLPVARWYHKSEHVALDND